MPQDLAHTHTYNATQQRCQSVIQQYSHHKLHTAHTEASFSHFAAFLFVYAEFSTKPRKFTCSCLSRVCYKHALNLTGPDSASVPATAILCIAQYWYMPELIKLWKEIQWKKQKSSYDTRSSCTASLPLVKPQNTFIHAVSLARSTTFQPST